MRRTLEMEPQRCFRCKGLERHRPNCPQLLQQLPKERPCPDCGSRLRMIRTISTFSEIYCYPEEPRSWVGLMRQYHCAGCGRIATYGYSLLRDPEQPEPDSSLPLPAAPVLADAVSLPLAAKPPEARERSGE
jgi:hypothetical protein